MKEYSKPGFHPVALALWIAVAVLPIVPLFFVKSMLTIAAPMVRGRRDRRAACTT